MKRKILGMFLILTFVFTLISNVQAASKMISLNTYNDIYELSKQGEKIELPFLNIFEKAATYDDEISHSGISIGSKTIDVNQRLSGIQVIFSNDTVTVKGELEHALIYARNIVIEGNVTGDVVLISPSIFITETAVLHGDVMAVGDYLEFKGNIEKSLITTCASIELSGKIEKDFRAITDNLELENEEIKGNIYLKTDMDEANIVAKYPKAEVLKKTESSAVETKMEQKDIATVILQGVVVVAIYTLACYLLTKKENNVVTKMTTRFKENTIFGLIGSILVLILVIVLPIILILMGVFGLGVVAWPVLIVYVGIILFSLSVSMFVTGSAIYESLKDKAGKYKIVVMALVFAVLYTLTKIDLISYYINSAINLISLGIILTYIFKSKKKEVKEAVKEEIKEEK